MKITFTNGQFIEYTKSEFFNPDQRLQDQKFILHVTTENHPMGAGLTAYYLGKSAGHKYQLVELDGSWLFIALRGSGQDLALVFKSDPLTESEFKSFANQHNVRILTKST